MISFDVGELIDHYNIYGSKIRDSKRSKIYCMFKLSLVSLLIKLILLSMEN